MSSKSGSSKVVFLRPPKAERRQSDELEFLPAALEIVETPASPVGRGVLLVMLALLFTAIAWACLGHIDIIATAPGRIIPSARVKLIQPLEMGVVKAIAVHDGEKVAAGQILVEIDSTSNAADQERVARDHILADLDLARIDALLAGSVTAFKPPAEAPPPLADLARRQLVSQLEEQQTRLDGLDRQIAAKTAERDGAVAMIAKINAALPLIAERASIYEKLRANEYTSRIQSLDSARALVEEQHDLVLAQQKVSELTDTIAALKDERSNIAAAFTRQAFEERTKADQQAADSRDEQLKLAQRTQLQTLRAPVEGTVEQLTVHTVGGVVTPGENLLVVVPDSSRLEIEAMLPNKDIGFVHAGQAVEIKVAAFSFTRYGLLQGVVMGVSSDAVSLARQPANTAGRLQHDVNDEDGPEDSPYIAHITLDRDTIMTEEGPMALGPGMSVIAEIKTGRRRIIDYLLSPLSRHRHDALQER